jgi:hypothetical protein
VKGKTNETPRQKYTYTPGSTAPMSTAKRTKLQPEVIAKERQSLLLRQQGYTFDEIASRLGYKGESGAREAFRRALLRTLQEPAREVRELEINRLDIAQVAIWDRVQNGDLPAIVVLLKIMERRAKYLGLDAPVKAQIEATYYDTEIIDAEVLRLIRILDSQPAPELD